jgi:hypothetical protein
MTITTTPSEINYAGDGVTTSFPIPFAFDSAADLKVLSRDSSGNVTTLTTGWSTTGGGGSTGNLTFTTAPAAGVTIIILDNPLLQQVIDYVSNDPFPAESHERGLDYARRVDKRLNQLIQRCARTEDGDPASGALMVFPNVSARRGKFAYWSDDSVAKLEPAVTLPEPTPLSASIIGAFIYPVIGLETSAGLSVVNIHRPYGDLRRYGADPTGVINATTIIQNALNMGGRIWCGENATYKVDGALLLDISKASLEGVGVTFDMSAGGTLQVFSTHVFDTSGPPKNWTHKISGIAFRGDLDLGHTGITVGRVGAAYGFSSEILFENCSFFQFDTLVAFTDNAWRTRFDHCGFEYTRDGGRVLSFPAGINNAGEVMQFDHCWFVIGSADLYLDTGHWFFNGCSFGVSVTIHGVSDARIDISSCNIEAQANTGYRMIRLNGVSNCTVRGGQFVVNLGANFGMSPILLESADASITFLGTHFPLAGSHLQFQSDATYNLRHLIVGPGNVAAYGCRSYSLATLAGPSNNVGFAKSANRLTNGDAEYGNESGWTKTAGGGATGTAVASALAALNGTRGFRLTAPDATDGITIHQDVPASDAIGRVVVFSFAAKTSSGTGTTATISLKFLDFDDAVIASATRADTQGTDSSWAQKAVVGYAPQGTFKIRIEIAVAPVVGGNVVDFDELCLNVI